MIKINIFGDLKCKIPFGHAMVVEQSKQYISLTLNNLM